MRDLDQLSAELRDAGVEYLFGAYVDVHGVPKSKCVPVAHLARMAAGSELYTVGALEGMGDLGPNEDECVAIPDVDRFTVLPWNPRYAIAPADLYFHGAPYSHDPRRVLRRQVEAAAEQGYVLNMGVEPEVYVLRQDEAGNWAPFVSEDLRNAPTRGYDLETTVLADPFLHPMVQHLNTLGWDVYSFDHEGGDGQYEFDFNYTDVLTMADRMVLFRLMSKHVARELGCVASFMPKPWSDAFGSGAHMNVSLADAATGENLFEEHRGGRQPEGPEGRDSGYSKIAYQFTAGVLDHAGAITALVCPTVNSYKRLNPRGLMDELSWAPVYRAYGHNNRTLACRLPMNRRCLEVRQADSAANFYLGAALVLAAGLEGVAQRRDPGPSVDVDTYQTSDEELAALGATRLPRTLDQALDELAADALARDVLGEAFHRDFVALKRREWEEYSLVVGDWERSKYLHLW